LICRQKVYIVHQNFLQNELCVNLEADFAIVCDGKRNVTGYGREGEIIPVGIVQQARIARYESVGDNDCNALCTYYGELMAIVRSADTTV
jgi:hypothetical protein